LTALDKQSSDHNAVATTAMISKAKAVITNE
jgi:hypothetical protein